ncbi:hypothetical protein [Granulicella tundricola]|uniref:Adenylate cyclase n=1 Tax=Granulicella tundricola (strain ATCC BAA-1859 / DSM 23138 / MP5ACTX9) TaxID=1198114 RepID=E8X5V8_GRATM|nr:hypothetical protein [Granulicella tundricola]ADW70842.1 hypothetical protein AciX9_4048 [Granulicella tundricola MP5ACTX9]
MQTEIQGIPSEVVEQQLGRLRSSPLFSHSRRYPTFLDYVVRKMLNGQGDELKERTVGIEAFGRASDYDLNADPVVRVTAGEVRKRLAQYYYDPEHLHELRIELRPGSYVPEFRLAESPAVGAPPSRALTLSDNNITKEPGVLPYPALPSTPPLVPVQPAWHDAHINRWRGLSICLAVALAVAIVAALMPHLRRDSATDLFWRPVIDANGPVMISVGSVVAMVNSNAVAPAPFTVSGHPLASDPIAVSDATALSSIQQVLSMRSKTSTLASSTGTSFSDLQKGPIVLICGFNNQWTMRITDPLRFHFVRTSTDDYTIQDRDSPEHRQWSINTAGAFIKMNDDYGLVARFHDPTTEQVVVVAAGIGENGTIAASQVLTDDRYLAELRRNKLLPRPDQNFEAIVQTQIIDGKPGPPRIVASYIW